MREKVCLLNNIQLEFNFSALYDWRIVHKEIKGCLPVDNIVRMTIPEVDKWGLKKGLKEFCIDYPSCRVYRTLAKDNRYTRKYVSKDI